MQGEAQVTGVFKCLRNVKENLTSISIRPIPMTSYLRMMGTGSVRPGGEETESGRGEFRLQGRRAEELEDSLLLEHRVLGLENLALKCKETRKLQ